MASFSPVGARIARAHARKTGQPFIKIMAISGRHRSFTYQGFTALAGLVSKLLDSRGLRPSGRVLICMPHQTSLYLAMYAVIFRGAVPVIMPPPNPKMALDDYLRMMSRLEQELEPDLIITNDDYLSHFSGRESKVVLASEIASVSGGAQPGLHSIPENDTLLIQYSSGTTGLKKGVEISHGAMLRQIDAYAKTIGFDENSVVCNWLPMYHDMGLVCCFWLPLLTGARVTQMSNFRWLSNPEIFLSSIQEERATHIWLPNFALSFMARWYNPARHGVFDLSSLKMITNCSEPITSAAQDAFITAFAGCGISADQLHSCFAMAETTFAMTSTTAAAGQRIVDVEPASLAIGRRVGPGDRRLVSSGTPLPGTRVRVSSESEPDLPDNTFGRIQVLSPSLASRYFKDRVVLSSKVEDGYFDTGDLGFLSNDHLFVVGREDDMIVAHGENHDPAAIEESLIDLEGVIAGRVAAFGAPVRDPATNDIVVLCESRLSHRAEIEALEDRIKARILATFNILPAVVRVQAPGSLMKSTSGKMARAAIRQGFLEATVMEKRGESGRVGGLRGKLIEFLERRLGLSDVRSSGQRLLSDGLIDSLGALEICFFLEEQTGLSVPLPNEVGFDQFESLDSIENLIARVDRGEISRRDLVAVGGDLLDSKVRAIQKAPNGFNCFFLSSSNLKSLPTAALNEDGRRYFNFWYSGATLPDFAAVLGFLAETVATPAKTVLISLDVERIAGFVHTPSAATVGHELLRRMLETRLGAIDPQHYAEYFATSRKRRLYDQMLFGDYAEDFIELTRDNGDVRFVRGGADLDAFAFRQASIKADLSALKMRLNRSVQTPTESLRSMFDVLSKEADRLTDRVVFILPPYHPECFSVISADPEYQAETGRVLEVIDAVFGERVQVLDHRDIRGFGGDPVDFRDSTHAGPRNAALLAAALRDQIQPRD